MLTLLMTVALVAGSRGNGPLVRTARVPDGGLQPQLAVDATGTLHLLFFRGDPLGGDLHYASSRDGGATFRDEMRVNRDDGDAIAIGNVRGGHLALGRSGRVDVAPVDAVRVHVSWMGSDQAKQRGPKSSAPMLYARLAADRKSFEPERNVVRAHPGLDGGGSIAADAAGHVYVTWHAPRSPKADDEAGRCVWVAASSDDGATFAEERAAWNEPTGACGCCGMRAGCRGEELFVLYRAAKQEVHRDLFALASRDHGRSFRGAKLDEWRVAQCVMSTASLAPAGESMLAAWEDEGDVAWARLDVEMLATAKAARPPAPADGSKLARKHPSVARNQAGEVLLAWTEGMGWQQGGTLVWQLFTSDGRPIDGATGRADGVPPWSLVAAAALPDGSFVVVY